jgi:hypothetical protein
VDLKYLQNSNPKTPRIFRPEIYKPGKIRLITSNIDAPTKCLFKWLTIKLKNILDPPELFVKNTQEFVEKVKDIQLAQDEVLITFVVEALYSSVPIPEAPRNSRSEKPAPSKHLAQQCPTHFASKAPTALP